MTVCADNFRSRTWGKHRSRIARRITKDYAGGSTNDEDVYFNEDFQALETRWNGSTNAYEQHVWDLKYIDAPILRYRDANGHTSSTSTGDGTSEEVLYFTFDANFNITGLVQENQTFVERYVYTPYGDRLVLTGTFGSRGTTSYDQQLGHQGLYTDVESGTIYNRGRQGYHPGLGNFTQRDQRLTDYQDGPNLYQGYRGNPVMGLDPSGLRTVYIVINIDASKKPKTFNTKGVESEIKKMMLPITQSLTKDTLEFILRDKNEAPPPEDSRNPEWLGWQYDIPPGKYRDSTFDWIWNKVYRACTKQKVQWNGWVTFHYGPAAAIAQNNAGTALTNIYMTKVTDTIAGADKDYRAKLNWNILFANIIEQRAPS